MHVAIWAQYKAIMKYYQDIQVCYYTRVVIKANIHSRCINNVDTVNMNNNYVIVKWVQTTTFVAFSVVRYLLTLYSDYICQLRYFSIHGDREVKHHIRYLKTQNAYSALRYMSHVFANFHSALTGDQLFVIFYISNA